MSDDFASDLHIRTPAPNILTIVGEDGERMVTIENDGNVTVHNEADINEAARIFWAAVQQITRGPSPEPSPLKDTPDETSADG